MNRTALIFTIALFFVFSSCKKELTKNPQSPETLNELNVPSGFSWKTTRDVNLTLSTQVNGLVNIINDQGITYQQAFLTANSPNMIKLTLPAFEKKITLRFQAKDTILNLTGSEMSYTFQ
jgi:hypothetical protein